MAYVEETAEAIKARVRAEEEAEREARAKQIALGNKPLSEDTRPSLGQKYTEEDVKLNPPIVIPAPKLAELERTIRPGTTLMVDVLAQSCPAYAQKDVAVPTEKTERKPSLILKPQTQHTELPALQPRGEVPLTGTEQRVAELAMRPVPESPYRTVKCPRCKEEVAVNRTYHTRKNGSTCIIDVEAARRDGVVAAQ